MKHSFQPGALMNAHKSGKKKEAHRIEKHMKSFNVKHTGSFHGKSNALGHGGRAAQMRAQGASGALIGYLARQAGAAPGQKNYHGKKAKRAKRKAPEPSMGDFGIVTKRKVAARGTTEKKRARKHSPKAMAGMREFMNEEAQEKKAKRKSAACKVCKGAHSAAKHAKAKKGHPHE